jgi:putative oxidoreductase
MTKTKKIIIWLLAAFVALGFLFAGITKLSGTEMQLKNLESWGYPLWIRFPIGLLELVLAVTILIPKYQKLTIYAVFTWTVAAVITHLQASQGAMIGAPILFSIVAAAILLLQRPGMTYSKSLSA